jgi:hypothetical protein
MMGMRFSLRSLIVVTTLIAAFLASYGVRVRALQAERAALAGTWRLIDEVGAPVVIAGKSVTINFDDPGTRLRVPRGGIGYIDFRLSGQAGSGISRAIYRRDGKRLRFAQADNGYARPSEFNNVTGHSLWLIERIAD